MHKTRQINIPNEALQLISMQAGRVNTPGIEALADAARACHGESVRAVLFYGSCLRNGDLQDGLADLYLLVDNYHSAYKGRSLAFFNQLLPPNVFYLEVPFQGHLLRAKYAVLTLDDFNKGVGGWFHSYLWGRFTQQCELVYCLNEAIAEQVHKALATAVLTFFAKTLPQMGSDFTARDLWSKGLGLSYRSELRPEDAEGAGRLFDRDPEYYQQLTDAIMVAVSFEVSINSDETQNSYHVDVTPKDRRLNWMGWRVRFLQGKVLSVLRLVKGLFTFKGGVDYILWKIERHSGVSVEVGPGLKRIPPLAVVVIFWRLFRQGAFR